MILHYWSPSLRPMTITPVLPIFQTEDTRYKTGASLLNNRRATKSEGKPDFSKNSSVVLFGPKLNKTQPFKNLQIHYYKLCRLSDSVAGNLQLYTSLGKFSRFWIAISCLTMTQLTPNLRIFLTSMCSFWLQGSCVVYPHNTWTCT